MWCTTYRKLCIHAVGQNHAGRMTRSTHSYGSHPSQLGELFLPAGAGPHPVAVVVHGGYWRAQYDRSLMQGICIDLAAHGVAAWNLEYRRVGVGGGWPETFEDVAAGIDLLAELDEHVDLSRVLAVGHSAGGQLALWAASRPGLPENAPGFDPRVVVRGAVSQAGVLDLTLAAGLMPSSSPTRALLGDPVKHFERYVLASPRERLPLGIPQLVLHGDHDDTVSMRIATSYSAAAHEVGDPCELIVLSHTGHFEHIDPGDEAWHLARDWLVSQASAWRS
jgi:acetyl esterase/lipase